MEEIEELTCKSILTLQKEIATFPCLAIGSPELGLHYTDEKFGMESAQYFHLHLLSEVDLSRGDYYGIYSHGMYVHKTGERFGHGWHIAKYDDKPSSRMVKLTPREDHGRIEASSDPSLGLAGIPENFLRKFTDDKKDINLQIDVKKETICVARYPMQMIHKITPILSDGNVIILPSKNTFTYSDIVSAWNAGYVRGVHQKDRAINSHTKHYPFDEWFNKNHQS